MEDHSRRRRLLTRLTAFIMLAAAGDVALVTPTLPARLDITPLSAIQIERRITRGTVEVMALQCDLTLNHGTGVAIAGDRLLTNHHVIGAPRVVDLAADLAPVVHPSALHASAGADLAVVDSDITGAAPFALAPDDPREGDHVWMAGYPHDGPGGTSKGLVVMPTTVVDFVDGAPMAQAGQVMRVGATARVGMSGGPVVDAAGRLVGIVFGVQTTTGNSTVLPVSAIRAVLAEPMVAPPRC